MRIRQLWRHFLREPFTWILYCFFQPLRFKKDIEVQHFSRRFGLMGRLALPLYLISLLLALLARTILCMLLPQAYHGYFLTTIALSDPHLVSFLFDTTWATLLAILAAILGGAVFGLAPGIAGGIAGGFWAGIVVHSSMGSHGYILVGSTVCAMVGFTIGVAVGSARDITRSSGAGTSIGSAVGIVAGMAIAFPFGMAAAYLGGMGAYSLLTSISVTLKSISGSVAGAILGALFGSIVAGIVIGIIRGIVRTRILHVGIERGLSLGTTLCVAMSSVVGGTMGTAVGGNGEAGIAIGLTLYIIPYFPIVLVFLVSYMLSYYRLPLYPVSGLSSFRAYLASRKNPQQVFDQLHHSALYWDECVFLPLPGLKRMLFLACDQDVEQTLEEIKFIVAERLPQMREAHPIALEITIRDLEERENLPRIAQTSECLAEMLPQEARLIDPRWIAPFARLHDASQEAARYCTTPGRQTRCEALERMRIYLKRVRPENAIEDVMLQRRLRAVIEKWSEIAQNELRRLEHASEEGDTIPNPYVPGPPLRANTSLFVGRRDLVRQLERALNQGIYRPSFFLAGERRMGKTSTLNQLPVLLGARYLPIIFDLQSRSISSSAAVLLGEIAEAIYKTLDSRGIWINKLEYVHLKEASHEHEAAVYRLFDLWFRGVEQILEREDRTILLAFDEFEKLAEVGQVRSLNLNLLLDWFRSVMQNRSRLALLFSGVRTLEEMELHWASYFVNVKVFKVGLLHATDACRLVTQPAHNFPGEEVFSGDVVEEIIQVTGCHPFLVQALCSELIDILNTEARKQACLQDVTIAVNNVLDGWGETYFRDMWERTSQEQRACLETLRRSGSSSIHQIIEQSALDERTVQRTLQKLLKRDLVIFEDGLYRIAVLIFSQWIECNAWSESQL